MRPSNGSDRLKPSLANRAAILVLIGSVLTLPCPVSAARTVNATVIQPRAFGHVLGDVLSQRILLSVDGRDAGEVPLPSTGRVGLWVERRQPRITKDAEGRRWMVLEYQITNAAPNLTEIELPSVELATATGAVLRVAAWPISAAPLTPLAPFRAGELQARRPDRLVVPSNDVSTHRRLVVMLSLMLATLTSWGIWRFWRNARDAKQLPFARAWSAIQKQKAAEVDSNDEAWFRVHHALNEAAGQVVQGTSLQALFLRAPYLQPLKPRLEDFYARSRKRFFDCGTPPESFALRELAQALYRAERRQ